MYEILLIAWWESFTQASQTSLSNYLLKFYSALARYDQKKHLPEGESAGPKKQ